MGVVMTEVPSVDYQARIAYLNSRKEKYQHLIDKTNKQKQEIENTSDSIMAISREMKDMVVSGESIDKGGLAETSKSLDSMSEVFNAVINICNRKIGDIEAEISHLTIQMQGVQKSASRVSDDSTLTANRMLTQ